MLLGLSFLCRGDKKSAFPYPVSHFFCSLIIHLCYYQAYSALRCKHFKLLIKLQLLLLQKRSTAVMKGKGGKDGGDGEGDG